MSARPLTVGIETDLIHHTFPKYEMSVAAASASHPELTEETSEIIWDTYQHTVKCT